MTDAVIMAGRLQGMFYKTKQNCVFQQGNWAHHHGSGGGGTF